MRSKDIFYYGLYVYKNNYKKSILVSISIMILTIFLIMLFTLSFIITSSSKTTEYNYFSEINSVARYSFNLENNKCSRQELEIILNCNDIENAYIVGSNHTVDFANTIYDVNKEYKGKNHIYLSNKYKNEYSIQDSYYVYDIYQFKVAGFLDIEDYIVDITYFNNTIHNIQWISFEFYPTSEDNLQSTIPMLNDKVEYMDSILNQDGTALGLDCIERSKFIVNIFNISLWVSAIIIIIVLAFTIVSSITLNFNDNKKFYGILKLHGLTDKDLVSVNLVNNGITVFIAILVGELISGILYTLYPTMVDKIMYFYKEFSYDRFKDYMLAVNIDFYVWPYIITLFLTLVVILAMSGFKVYSILHNKSLKYVQEAIYEK